MKEEGRPNRWGSIASSTVVVCTVNRRDMKGAIKKMDSFSSLGKLLVIGGAFLLIAGGFLLLLGKITPFGRLPGDIFYQKGNFTFYFPLVTCLLLSILLTLIVNLFLRR